MYDINVVLFVYLHIGRDLYSMYKVFHSNPLKCGNYQNQESFPSSERSNPETDLFFAAGLSFCKS